MLEVCEGICRREERRNFCDIFVEVLRFFRVLENGVRGRREGDEPGGCAAEG